MVSIATLFWPVLSLGQAIPKTTEPDQFHSTTFQGTVVDGTGKPVAGATVFLNYHRGRPSATSGADGSFSIEAPPRSIVHDQMFADLDANMSDYVPLGAAVGKRTTLTLKPAKSVKAVVRDPAGKPIPDAWIQVVGLATGSLKAQKTDAHGQATLLYPPNETLQHLVAYKDDIGLDWKTFAARFPPSGIPSPFKPPGDDPIALTLNGARSVTVRVRDDQNKPLAGVDVSTWIFVKKNRGGDDLNIAGMEGFHVPTNADGVVQFKAIPADAERGVEIWANSETHLAKHRTVWRPEGPDDVNIVMEPKVELSGVVLTAEGKPADGAIVEITSRAPDPLTQTSYGFQKTDAAGRFRHRGGRNQYYMLAAYKDASASQYATRIVAKDPVSDLQLTLEPATRVFGTAKMSDGSPLKPKSTVWLSQEGPDYNSLPPEQQTIGKFRNYGGPTISYRTEVKSDGMYQVWVGRGSYRIGASNLHADSRNFAVNGEPEIRQDLTVNKAFERIRLDGRVVLSSDPSKGAAGASVGGNGTTGSRFYVRPVQTRDDGKFTLEREAGDGLFEARSLDGKLAGTAQIKGAQKTVVIRIGPTATIKGRLVDAAGAPIPKREVLYTSLENTHVYTGHFSGKTKTNEKGEFEFPGLVVGCKYWLTAATQWDEKGEANAWKILPEITAPLPGVFDAGDLKLR